MSGGSVFGMTSDFNFEQSPYNEGALNSVENRQIANNPKSVEQVGKTADKNDRFRHKTSLFCSKLTIFLQDFQFDWLQDMNHFSSIHRTDYMSSIASNETVSDDFISQNLSEFIIH